MKVEVHSDIECPWCYIGERRFARALEPLESSAEVDVVIRPFQLDPGTLTTAVPTAQYLEERFGGLARAMQARVSAAGARIEVLARDLRRAREVGVRAVFTLVIDDTSAIEGAQATDVFRRALEQVAQQGTGA